MVFTKATFVCFHTCRQRFFALEMCRFSLKFIFYDTFDRTLFSSPLLNMRCNQVQKVFYVLDKRSSIHKTIYFENLLV